MRANSSKQRCPALCILIYLVKLKLKGKDLNFERSQDMGDSQEIP